LTFENKRDKISHNMEFGELVRKLKDLGGGAID